MKLLALATVSVCLLSPLATSADVLLLDAIAQEPPNSGSGLLRPRSGMKMDQVRAAFGAPGAESPAVGEPPISRWDYSGYSVYFEHDMVLRTVVHR